MARASFSLTKIRQFAGVSHVFETTGVSLLYAFLVRAYGVPKVFHFGCEGVALFQLYRHVCGVDCRQVLFYVYEMLIVALKKITICPRYTRHTFHVYLLSMMIRSLWNVLGPFKFP